MKVRFSLQAIITDKMTKNNFNNNYFNKFDKKDLVHKYFIYLIDRKEPVFNYLKHSKSGDLLDLACGNGKFLAQAKNYFNCWGIDISKDGIKQAKIRCWGKVVFINKDVNNLKAEFNKLKFDVITCFDLLEHVKNYNQVLKDSHELLKRDGWLIVSVPNCDSWGRKIKKDKWFGYSDPTHINFFSQSRWRKIFWDNKFKIKRVYYNGLMDTPYITWLPKIVQDGLLKYPTQLLSVLGLKLNRKLGEVSFFILEKIS